MKRFKSGFLIILSLILTLSLLSACSSSKNDSYDLSSQSSDSMEEIGDMGFNETAEEKGQQVEELDKIISTYYMNLETIDFEKSKQEIDSLIKDQKAFIENSNISSRAFDNSRNYRSGDFSIRIPKENIDKFKDSLAQIGNVTQENINKEDVTKFYRDTESRLKVVTSKEKRLLELLEKASKIEDIIIIESELTDTIYEKETLEKDLKSVDEKVEYATLNLQLIEVRNFSNVEGSDSSLSLRLKNAFKDSTFAFKVAMENFIIWLVYALPYLIIIIPLLVLAIIFIRKRTNKS